MISRDYIINAIDMQRTSSVGIDWQGAGDRALRAAILAMLHIGRCGGGATVGAEPGSEDPPGLTLRQSPVITRSPQASEARVPSDPKPRRESRRSLAEHSIRRRGPFSAAKAVATAPHSARHSAKERLHRLSETAD